MRVACRKSMRNAIKFQSATYEYLGLDMNVTLRF